MNVIDAIFAYVTSHEVTQQVKSYIPSTIKTQMNLVLYFFGRSGFQGYGENFCNSFYFHFYFHEKSVELSVPCRAFKVSKKVNFAFTMYSFESKLTNTIQSMGPGQCL